MESSFYIARITHNRNRWKKPSGPEHKSGSYNSKRIAFEAQYDFGFEEWLLDSDHIIDGWQYGYIESIGEKHKDKPLILHTLEYSVNRTGPATRSLVGFINEWEYIGNQLPALLSTVLPSWQQQMKDDLSKVEGIHNMQKSLEQIDLHGLHPIRHTKPLVNIRFKLEHLNYYYDRRISSKNLTGATGFTIVTKNWQDLPVKIQSLITKQSSAI